jgi:hypothetical protein
VILHQNIQNREHLVLLGRWLDIAAAVGTISVKKYRSRNWTSVNGTKE